MTPHPEYERLFAAVVRCLSLAGAWAGDVFRFAVPRWATAAHLLTGEGALHAGGRWHPVGAFRAVYASLDPETALAESLAHYRRFGVADRDAMPRTLNAVAVALHRVLDLTDGAVRRHLAFSQSRMLAEEWWARQAEDGEAMTQALGRAAWTVSLEGLIVPSAPRPGGRGLVFFPDNQLATSTLTIVNPNELPRRVP
jgi:RES domain-containing protein